jgi:hypothetical protein
MRGIYGAMAEEGDYFDYMMNSLHIFPSLKNSGES